MGHVLRRCLATGALSRLCVFVYYSGLVVTVLEALSVLYSTLLGWSELPTFGKWSLIFLQVLFTISKWEHIRMFYGMYTRAKADVSAYTRLAAGIEMR